MCRGAVAAPRALQLIVYPISLKKSLLFCEKIEKSENISDGAASKRSDRI